MSPVMMIEQLPMLELLFFGICVLAVCAFEFVNGFHDTANAVATVIYTNSLKPMTAVIWSGIWNFLGVMAGGVSVAMGIIHLLPLQDIIESSVLENIAVILAVLVSAIGWNLYTWYKGIPCSSSHTMIGALLGVGLGFQFVHGGTGVNWGKAGDIGLALLVSPFVGFSLVIIVMFIMKLLSGNNKEIFKEPKSKQKPPLWIRGLLILTCTGVSYSHGSNDGQKGVGLLMLVLIAFLPLNFVLNPDLKSSDSLPHLAEVQTVLKNYKQEGRMPAEVRLLDSRIDTLRLDIAALDVQPTNKELKYQVRKEIESVNKQLKVMLKEEGLMALEKKDRVVLEDAQSDLKKYTDFAPTWVVLVIAISLGLGTTIGWKRIVVTIGEKIGKAHLTYAQGASAELVAATTIGMSTWFGLPVSTTQVLSSGIAGSMVASKGLKNLQKSTIVNIAMAWLFTLPVTLLGGGGLYMLFYYVLAK